MMFPTIWYPKGLLKRILEVTLTPQGAYSGFQVTGMIEWIQKSRPKKISGPKIDPPKNPMPILWPLKVPERGNAITQRKTLEI